MILIAHRGNINGPDQSRENEPAYIDIALAKGYDVEIDVRVVEGVIYLGHDEPQHMIDLKWILDRALSLWIHCKNLEAVEYFYDKDFMLNFFWHQEDHVTLTNLGYIWAFPGKQPIRNSIAVLPELYSDSVDGCVGVCSDYIVNYKK
jgi:hypothetical protein